MKFVENSSSRKSVLIICQHFVPYTPSVGGVARVVYLIRYLREQGHDVCVLSSAGVDFGYLGFQDDVSQIEVTYLRDPLKQRMQRAIVEHGDKRRSGISWFWLRLAKNLLGSFLIPDVGVCMVGGYYTAAKKIIADRKVDTVFVSTPPHSMQLVGALLKRRFGNGLTVVADYRDSWNASSIFAPKGLVAGMLSRKLESISLSKADIITYVSAPMIRNMGRVFSGLEIEKKALLMMNGYAGDPCRSVAPSSSGIIKIGYFGIADDNEEGYRNIEPLLSLVSGAVAVGSKINIIFFGSLRLARLNIDDFPFVKFGGSVDHGEVFKLMQEMDYLLVLHTDPSNSDEVITGKFFDYIKARRPILCYAPAETEAVRLVKQWGLGVWLDVLTPSQALGELTSLDGRTFPALQDDKVVGRFSRNGQYAELLRRLIKKI